MDAQDARNMALELLDVHHLSNQGWTFGWNSSHRKFGWCGFTKKQILLSHPLVLVNSPERVKDTVLHEIAHALVGPGHHHGRVWKDKAREIGGTPRTHWDDSNTVRPATKYIGTCPNGHITYRNARSKKTACGRCCRERNGGKYSPEFIFTYRFNSDGISPTR